MARSTKPYRCWINQPSTLQPLHELHGKRAIAVTEKEPGRVTIYFTEGDVLSMLVSELCISKGTS